MDNESEDGTAHIAEQAGAVVFSQPLKGYGDAIRKGLEKAKGDIFILSEADGINTNKRLTWKIVNMILPTLLIVLLGLFVMNYNKKRSEKLKVAYYE